MITCQLSPITNHHPHHSFTTAHHHPPHANHYSATSSTARHLPPTPNLSGTSITSIGNDDSSLTTVDFTGDSIFQMKSDAKTKDLCTALRNNHFVTTLKLKNCEVRVRECGQSSSAHAREDICGLCAHMGRSRHVDVMSRQRRRCSTLRPPLHLFLFDR